MWSASLVIIAALCSAVSVSADSVVNSNRTYILWDPTGGRATSISQMTALADDKKAQLREWFASARRRSLPVVPVPFGLTAADLFARPASKSGGAFDPAWKSTSASGYPKNYCGVRYPKNYQYRLGVDFTAAREPFVLADVGVLPEIHGRPRKQTLRLAQQMTEGGIAGVLWNAGRALTFMLPRPVHKSNFRSASPPLLNHDLHAIDAARSSMVWRCGSL